MISGRAEIKPWKHISLQTIHLILKYYNSISCEEDNLLHNLYICIQVKIMYTIYLIDIYIFTPL